MERCQITTHANNYVEKYEMLSSSKEALLCTVTQGTEMADLAVIALLYPIQKVVVPHLVTITGSFFFFFAV